VLTALPSKQLGTVPHSVQSVYNFQPGDVLCYEYIQQDPTMSPGLNQRYTYGDSVLSRTASRTGDTLTYLIMRHYPTGGGRNGPYTLAVSRASHPLLGGATGRYDPTRRFPRRVGTWIQDLAPNSRLPRTRLVLRLYENGFCGIDTIGLAATGVDRDRYFDYSAGLGEVTRYSQTDICCYSSTLLIGYRKGVEQWGNVFRIARPLAVRSTTFATAPTAVPNPFRQELTIKFELGQPQRMQIQVLNALGQQVLETDGLRPGGVQQLVLPTVALAAGLYTVRFLPAVGTPQFLKVVKVD
jgi:hypothetical protein